MTDNPAFWRLLYLLPILLAGFGMACVATLLWRHRRQRGGLALWIVCASSACWAFGEGLGFAGFSQDAILFFWKVAYIGDTVAPLALVVFALTYVGYAHLLTRARIALLLFLPVVTFVAVWTNEWHGLIWARLWMDHTTPFPTLANSHGPLLWVYFAYCILLVAITALFLLRRMGELPPPQRRQVRLMLLAMFVPVLANILYMARLIPLRNIDVTPLAFNIVVIIFVRNLLLERLFDLVPVSAHEIYRSLGDAVFVIDNDNRVIDLNQAAAGLLSSASDAPVGQPLSDLLPDVAALLRDPNREGWAEVMIDRRYYDVRATVLHGAAASFSGRLLVWREITERKRLEAELQQLAITDSLTGLWNRRHFFQRGDKEIERALRYQRPLSLILIDIDHFKQINDRHGHESGDRVLIEMAHVLNRVLRGADCVARIGGEEFALLLPETDALAAAEVAQRLLGTIRLAHVPAPGPAGGQADIRFSVSAGVVTLAPGETTLQDLLRRADDAMYRAKDAGRDQVVC